MRNVYLVTFLCCVLLVSIFGFRGTTFTHPPMDVFPEWLFPGMKYQPKLRPQSASNFFADGMADRMPPAHTVMRSMADLDDHMYRGRDASGQFAHGFPAAIKVDLQLLKRGQDRYNIYCAPCHGYNGAGDGITSKYGIGSLASNGNYNSDRIRNMPEGQIFDTITNGSASKVMLPYGDKLTPQDRWAVVAYVRALERTQQGTVADVTDPEAKKTLGIK
ncbi:MAG TPA: cytochrome c [Opitutaceae bacterium]|nr:cytochrome c [Opitutaceae bacterium]